MRQLGNMKADEVVRGGGIMKDDLSQRKSAGMPRNFLPLKKKQDSKRLRRMSLTVKSCALADRRSIGINSTPGCLQATLPPPPQPPAN